MAADEEYHPTYRQKEVDTTLDDHETRIGRLEKAFLVGMGYGLAEGYNIVEAVSGFII
jgi:hypothetical protein